MIKTNRFKIDNEDYPWTEKGTKELLKANQAYLNKWLKQYDQNNK